MNFYKSLSLALISSQLGFAGIALANSAPTPEFSLLQNVIALQGQGLDQATFNAQLTGEMTQYLQTANAEGQQQRLQDALVDLGVYTPAQASAFIADARSSNSELTADEVTHFADLHPAGAQFSSCLSGTIGAVELGSGIVSFLIGAILDTNEKCSAPEYTEINGGVVNHSYGPTTCTHPDRGRAVDFLYSGGSLAVMGAILVLSRPGC